MSKLFGCVTSLGDLFDFWHESQCVVLIKRSHKSSLKMFFGNDILRKLQSVRVKRSNVCFSELAGVYISLSSTHTHNVCCVHRTQQDHRHMAPAFTCYICFPPPKILYFRFSIVLAYLFGQQVYQNAFRMGHILVLVLVQLMAAESSGAGSSLWPALSCVLL